MSVEIRSPADSFKPVSSHLTSQRVPTDPRVIGSHVPAPSANKDTTETNTPREPLQARLNVYRLSEAQMVQNLSSQSRQSLTEVNSLPKREISVRESGSIYVILQKDLSAPACQTDCSLTFCCFYANVKHLDLLCFLRSAPEAAPCPLFMLIF